MSWKTRKKQAKAERRRAQREQVNDSSHLLMQGWPNKQTYQQWWVKHIKHHKLTSKMEKTQPKTMVKHDELLDMPWHWQVGVLDRDTHKRTIVKSGNEPNTATLFVQGNACFLAMSGSIQKLTEAHTITIVDDDKTTFHRRPSKIAEWVTNNENKLRGFKEPEMKTHNRE